MSPMNHEHHEARKNSENRMSNKKHKPNSYALLIPILLACMMLTPGCTGDHAPTDPHDDHAEGGADNHDDHDDYDDHDDEIVRLNPEQLAKAGVRVEALGGGVISTQLTLPAEVGLNLDRVLHITPRAGGIVTEVRAMLGHEVQSGELMAVIESPELGEAKIEYLQAVQGEEIARSRLEQEEIVSQNTSTLLEALTKHPEPEALSAIGAGLRIGESKGRLLSAYAALRAAEANLAREQELRQQGLATEADVLYAQEMFSSGQARYGAEIEEIGFSHRLQLREARSHASLASSRVENARRRLHLLGLTTSQVDAVGHEPDEQIARYGLIAPMSGTVVAKHITPGEKVGGEAMVYTLADLSTVWLDISVYASYAGQISQGQRVTVHADGHSVEGTVVYMSPIIDRSTRTMLARVVIENPDGLWRAGAYVTARVEIAHASVARAVPLGAVQSYEGRDVVFVEHDGGFAPVPVTLGRRDDTLVELLGDAVQAGDRVVVENSFLMKAELGKGAAGHDH